MRHVCTDSQGGWLLCAMVAAIIIDMWLRSGPGRSYMHRVYVRRSTGRRCRG